VVNSRLDRARLYFKHRPTQLTLVADPERASHSAFGTPSLMTLHGLSRDEREALLSGPNAMRVDPTGELGTPLPFLEARHELNSRDGYVLTPEEEAVRAAGAGVETFFLIDREGVIRWRWIEAMERPNDIGLLPSPSELVAAARTVVASVSAV
jgi:hypothetical protein